MNVKFTSFGGCPFETGWYALFMIYSNFSFISANFLKNSLFVITQVLIVILKYGNKCCAINDKLKSTCRDLRSEAP